MSNDKSTMIIDVICCARCEQNHYLLEFFPFTNHNPNYSHFAYCPNTKEPILLKFEKSE